MWGNQTLELRYDGENQARGNIYIYAPAQKLLVLIDVVSPGWVRFAYLAISSNIPGWIAAHDKVLAYDFVHHVGTSGRAGTRADMLVRKEYMQGLFTGCKQALGLTATGNLLLSAAVLQGAVKLVNPGNPWVVFRGYLAVVTEYCGYCGDAANV